MLNVVVLTHNFDKNNGNLIERLDDKGRGYGVIRVEINTLVFAIPLRSNLSHKSGIVLDQISNKGRVMRRGLDYTKALLIRDEQKELGSIFTIPNQQKKTLISNEKRIITQFTKYVEGYISAVQKNTKNTLNSTSYRYSTLPNYHSELGL